MSSANQNRFLDPSKGRFYTLGEELFNSISHGVGVLAAIACCSVIIVAAAFTGDPWKVVSSSVYGTCMILLFLFSTLYHSLTNATAKKVFRAFDHLGIFLLIAGSYTPSNAQGAPWLDAFRHCLGGGCPGDYLQLHQRGTV